MIAFDVGAAGLQQTLKTHLDIEAAELMVWALLSLTDIGPAAVIIDINIPSDLGRPV